MFESGRFEIQTFLGYFDGVRERTRRVVRCVPPDQMEWRIRPGAFSFGDTLRHLATLERDMFVENACRRPSRYRGHTVDLAEGYDAVLEFEGRLHGESIEILSTLTPEDLQAKCETPAGTPITVWKWLRAMVEHEAHHRGQDLPLPRSARGRDTSPLRIDLGAGARAQSRI